MVDPQKLSALVKENRARGSFGMQKDPDDEDTVVTPQESDDAIVLKSADHVKIHKETDEIIGLVKDFDPDDTGVAPAWADETIWARAVKAVKAKWDDYDEPWAVVAAAYKAMGGELI